MGELWVAGECVILLFFLVVIPCLKSVFIAPCFQFVPLSLATVPEMWAGRERLERPVLAPVVQPKSCQDMAIQKSCPNPCSEPDSAVFFCGSQHPESLGNSAAGTHGG